MRSQVKIDLSYVLPDIPDERDGCVDRFIECVEAKQGVDAAHLVRESEAAARALCLHYDPEILTLADVRELSRRVGLELSQRYGHWQTELWPMHARRASAIESRLSRVDGVLEAVVAPDGTVRVEFDRERVDEARIRESVNAWSKASPSQSEDHAGHAHARGAHDHTDDHSGHPHRHGGLLGPKSELIFATLCGLFLLLGWLLEAFSELPHSISVATLLIAYLLGGYFTSKEAFEKLRSGRFEIDFLMLIAAAGAAALGAWTEGALLLFLFSIGHALEGYAMGRAKRAIEALSELAPRTACVRRSGEETEVDVGQLQVGDLVIVKPDERIPADGFVVAGETSVDQAPITGESVPVDKQPVSNPNAAASAPESVAAEHRVFAGTINQAGAIEIQVTKTAAKNTLARVVAMVREAETRISPTQQLTKRFERYFVPSVIVTVVVLLFAPLLRDESFRQSFYRAMAVLVAASPCALAIATPSAVLSGVARAARGGILVKGGGPLERLGRLDAVAFDKTGTLTTGAPRVTDIRPAAGVSEAELLRIAIAVEDLSIHPLAKAVVRDGKEKLDRSKIPAAVNFRSITGRGIEAEIRGKLVHVGKDDLFAEVAGPPLPAEIRDMVATLEGAGRTTMIVRHADKYLGVIGLMDTPREAAKRTILRLRALGIQRMIMISGDNQQVTDAVAKAVGLDEARGDLMPEDKVKAIKQLNSGAGVAMIGDGVNDAPAMASAAVGIAMGAAGSDVALETADVALMADNLDHLPLAIGLSRATRSVIRQNLWMSLGMVALLVPATLFGLNIGPAVALHEGSTLVVVFNALRLLGYASPSNGGLPE